MSEEISQVCESIIQDSSLLQPTTMYCLICGKEESLKTEEHDCMMRDMDGNSVVCKPKDV
jgi:hypothetical protein